MTVTVQRIEVAGFEQVLRCRDLSCGLDAWIAVHSTRRGPAFGGIRRRTYAHADQALAEVCELAHAMARKCALAGLPAGGAKTVVCEHDGLQRVPAYEALGAVIEGLAGAYVCGPDVGTGSADLEAVRRNTQFVNPAGNDAAASTAAGVLAGLRGAMVALKWPTLAKRRCVIQGLGAVGTSLARSLVAAGCDVVGTDPLEAAREAAARLGVGILPGDRPWEDASDVFLPCALGHVLTPARSSSVGSRVICGSANNQASSPTVARLLHDRGCVWIPDILVSAGAVIEGVWTVRFGQTEEARRQIEASLESVEASTARFIAAACEANVPPHDCIVAAADDAIARGA